MAARHGGAHCSAFRHWKCPQLGQGREHIMFSPLPKLWALPMSESGAMSAAVFFQCDSRPLFDTFCLGKPVGFPSAKKWNKTQPTTGQTSYTFGIATWSCSSKQQLSVFARACGSISGCPGSAEAFTLTRVRSPTTEKGRV